MSQSRTIRLQKVEQKPTENLKDELFRLEPKIDLLHDLLGWGRYAEVHWDGQVFLGRRHRDIGFNDFLGKPSEAALKRTKALLERMSDANREQALRVLAQYGITVSYSFTVVE